MVNNNIEEIEKFNELREYLTIEIDKVIHRIIKEKISRDLNLHKIAKIFPRIQIFAQDLVEIILDLIKKLDIKHFVLKPQLKEHIELL